MKEKLLENKKKVLENLYLTVFAVFSCISLCGQQLFGCHGQIFLSVIFERS